VLWLAGVALLLGTTLSPAQSSSKTTGSKATKKTTTRRSHRRRRPRGQQKMDAKRVRQIQEALVREHYLTKASGKWDVRTQQAMQKYQSDNGWQSKVVPDSRALIKLGLGPDNDRLLNPESAMTTAPPATHTTSDPPEDPKQ
jgi:peptidoglycan hydrolase-like protein with peptidoglycan-binding domain